MILFKKKIDFLMTDIHSHILPETDDGAKDIKTAIQMLEIAHADGISTILATPHFHPAKCMISQDVIDERVQKLEEIAVQLYGDFKLYSGREIYYTSDISDNIRDNRLLLNNTEYAMVEFDFHANRQSIRSAINNVMNEGLIPVVAHIERYYDCLNDLDFAYDLKEMGAIIQVNSTAITGDEGKEARKYVKELLKAEVVDVVATDAHSAGHRAPHMKESVEWIASKYGEDYARRISKDNPEKIINGIYIE